VERIRDSHAQAQGPCFVKEEKPEGTASQRVCKQPEYEPPQQPVTLTLPISKHLCAVINCSNKSEQQLIELIMEQVQLLNILTQLKDDIRADISQFKEEIREDIERNRNLTISELKESISEVKKSHEEVKRTVAELDREKRRKNIILFGIKEEFNKYWDLENFVLTLFKDKLQVGVNVTELDFIKRLGKPNGNQARPILVGFVQFRTKLLLLQSSGKLKGTNISISEDYPKGVAEIRKLLRPKLIEARREGKYAIIKYDKLIIMDNLKDELNKKRVLPNSPSLPPTKKVNKAGSPEEAQNTDRHNLDQHSNSKSKLEKYKFTQRGIKELEKDRKTKEEKETEKNE